MKTNYFISRKLSTYSVFGLIALVFASCSSYQNKSYYDNDGVYGSSAPQQVANDDQKNNEKYREYFSNLNKETEEVFTDVNSYTTNDSIKNGSVEARNYNAWGSNANENITINVYDNGWNNWGWGWNNWGWGWNSWYGPGWGWNNWGWGWNNWYGPGWGWNNWGWGWNNGWCNGAWNNAYHGNHFAVVSGRRDVRSTFTSGRTAIANRSNNFYGSRFNSNNPRSFSTRNNTFSGSRSNNVNPRNQDATTPRSNYSTPRSNSVTPRSNNNTRDYSTPRSNNSSPRSYSPSYSPSRSSGGGGGGGFRGGGGGGGRSGGGGRR